MMSTKLPPGLFWVRHIYPVEAGHPRRVGCVQHGLQTAALLREPGAVEPIPVCPICFDMEMDNVEEALDAKEVSAETFGDEDGGEATEIDTLTTSVDASDEAAFENPIEIDIDDPGEVDVPVCDWCDDKAEDRCSMCRSMCCEAHLIHSRCPDCREATNQEVPREHAVPMAVAVTKFADGSFMEVRTPITEWRGEYSD